MLTGRLSSELAIALDGGTTNTRARLVANGQVIGEAKRAVGARDSVLRGGDSPIAAAIRACLNELEAAFPAVISARIVASGMLSSEVGLVAVPHVMAPAGLEELARAAVTATMPAITDRPILFIPGVRTPASEGPNGWTKADLMRGEECETLGVLEPLGLNGPVALIWPGSHTKLVAVDSEGKIINSTTSLAGEITAAISTQTLIAKSLPKILPDRPDQESVILGIRVGANEGLGRAAFLVRIADVNCSLTPDQRAAFWMGAVIGNDVAHLMMHPMLTHKVPVWVGGREPQKTIYVQAFQVLAGRSLHAIDADLANRAAAIGAIKVARAVGWLG